MKKYILILGIAFILLLASLSYSQITNAPIPNESRQMILVLTDSASAAKGYLYRYERKDQNSNWKLIKEKVPIVLGRNGLAWGRGLHQIDSSRLSIKTEGDGKSPAGVFTLSAAFGYADSKEMKGLKIPYILITELRECIDDIKSEYYNKVINNNEVEKVDWQSSEKMFYTGIWYEQGVIVDQNIAPIVKGAGSCIFLHNWSAPDETSAGCTEMNPINMKEIIYWLDYSLYPVLVQLTKQLYEVYQQSWKLPNKINAAY